jgi:hypothetical protein
MRFSCFEVAEGVCGVKVRFTKLLDKGLVLWYNIRMKVKIKNKEVQ